MQNISKQFGGKDTGSFEQRFHRSIVWLTILYTTALAVILFISGTASYSAFSNKVHQRFRGFPQAVEIIAIIPRHMPTETDVQEDFVESIIVVDGLLLFVGVLLSYWLAKRTLQPIKDAYQRQQQFLSDASHELRTPLSILQLELENDLTHDKKNEKIKSKLEEVARMGSIVSDLLFLSRLDEGKKEYTLSATDIVATATQTLARLEPLFQMYQVKGTIAAQHEQQLVMGNEELLSHALINIVKNAVLYNRADGSVTLEIEEQTAHVLVRITDTGRGIPAAALAHIFDRFYRVDESRSRGTGGSGLGLAIAKSAIEKMNGTVDLLSEVDKGTIVTIILPKA